MSDKVDRILALIDEGLLEHEGQTASDYSQQGPGFGVEDTELEYTVRERPPDFVRSGHTDHVHVPQREIAGGLGEEVGDGSLPLRVPGNSFPHVYVVAPSYQHYTRWKQGLTPLERRQVRIVYVSDSTVLRGTHNPNVLVIGVDVARRPDFSQIMDAAAQAEARVLNDQF